MTGTRPARRWSTRARAAVATRVRAARGAHPDSPAGRGDGGSYSLQVAVLSFALLLLIGLVVDGALHLRTSRTVQAVAQEAARAGAQAAQRPAVDGPPVVDRAAAVRAAQSYLASAGYTGSVTPVGRRDIAVTVTTSRSTAMLCVIGVCSISSTGTAQATLGYGTSREER